ncbi:MAG: DUF6701 domain-containing protein [Gallionella sp.]
MSKKNIGFIAILLAVLTSFDAAAAAVCTSKASGSWAAASTWTCVGTPVVTIPTATDTAVVASPNTVTLVGSVPVTNLTVNSGGTLADGGNTLTITGNLTNNGTISGGGNMNVTGAASVISGVGTYTDTRLYTSGASPSVAAGSTLNFTGSSRLYVGRTQGGTTVAGSVLTINGTINSTVPTATTTFLRLYATSTVIGATGVVSAATSAATFNTSTAKLTNNGSVTLQKITQNAATNSWTQGANASLTLSAISTVGTLNASASGNTVTYNSPATPITPSSNTYYNLAGTGVVCPVSYIILGTSPCTGALYVQGSPTSCTSVTGVGTIAWVNPANAISSNNVYATAANVIRNTTTNYLNCTGFNLNAPTGAIISGITVYVERKTSGGTIRDAFVYLIKGGTISTALNAATTTNYPTADAIEAHGGQTNLWGTTWTVAEVNAANFGLAFSAKNTSTTSTTNRTISVDHIQVRVDYTLPALHHIQIEHDGAGQTCAAEQLTVKACADAACTSNFTTANVSGNVTWAGAPGGTIPFALTSGGSGQTTVSLPVTTAQTVTLGTSAVSPTPTTASGCTNLSGGAACSLTFTASTQCRDTVEVGAAAGTSIFTKLAGTAFSLDVLSVGGANYTGTVQVELVDAATGSCATYPQLNTQNVAFANQNRKTVAFTLANAVKSAKVRMTGSAASSCSTDKFAIRPTSLTVTSSVNADPSGTNASAVPKLAAGASFTLTATAIAGYNGTPTVDATQIVAHSGAVANGSLGGSFAVANPVTGVATASTFNYSEVGYFKFNVDGVRDTTFADVDALKATPECTSNYSNTLVGGKYGCYFGNAAATAYFGRFVPDHFDTVAADECGTFTYSGQPFALEVRAKDVAGTTLQNYSGAFARAVGLSDALNAAALGAFNPATVAAVEFTQGVATIIPSDLTPVRYIFANVRTIPTTIGVRAIEAAGGDGVSSATPATPNEDVVNIRSGRLWLGNAYGSEMLDLPMPLLAQYWDGSNFITNVDDDVAAACTSLPIPALTLQPGATAVAATLNDPLVAGDGGLVLTRPNVAGTVDVTITAPTWLQYDWTGAGLANPTARATFGVYGGSDMFIYRGRRGR